MQLATSSAKADRRPLRACINDWLYEERALLARIAGAALVLTCLSLATPQIVRLILDTALPNASPRLLVVVVMGILVLAAHSAWMSWIQALMGMDLALKIERSALIRVVRAMLHGRPDPEHHKNAGWVMTTVDGAGRTARTYAQSYVTVLTASPLCIGYLICLATYSPAAAGVVIAATLVTSALALSLVRLESDQLARALECKAAEQQYLHLLLSRLGSIRGLFVTERLTSRWCERVNESAEARQRTGAVGILKGQVEHTGSRLLSTGLMLWAVYQCFARELSIGDMMFLMLTATGLSSSLSSVIQVFLGLWALGPYMSRVDQLVESSNPAPEGRAASLAADDRIVVNGVWFRYSAHDRWILQDCHWQLPRGAVMRLCSPSGSGKSTLLRLIAGLVTPERGSISIFGLTPEHAHEVVLYVPQSCDLFETSIRSNLELFSGAPWEDIERVAALTGLSQLLGRLPMREDTLVSAQGQNLSAGQRQLVLLTAAFASSRPVLLLDESLSQIDAYARSHCRWDELTTGRTVIWVEHA